MFKNNLFLIIFLIIISLGFLLDPADSYWAAVGPTWEQLLK